MVDKGFKKYWKRLKVSVYAELVVAITVRTLATIMLILALFFGLNISFPMEFLFIAGGLLAIVFTIFSPILYISDKLLIKRLHAEFGQLEYSLHLFFKSQLSEIEKFQSKKILTELPAVGKIEKFYNWRVNILYFISAFIACTLLYMNPLKQASLKEIDPETFVKERPLNTSPSKEGSVLNKGILSVVVSPPSYTGINTYTLERNEKFIEEGSQVKFNVAGSNTDNYIIWNAVDTISINVNSNRAWDKANISNAFSFQAYSIFRDSVLLDSVRVVEIKRDQLPQITVSLKENRINRTWDNLSPVKLPLLLKDDYGLSRANMVATLSKGEGEAVKFRELKWSIGAVKKGLQRQNIAYQLKIDTLNMAPGDELYFYIELFDNKYPEPQRAKSDVYFLTIADTTIRESANYDGLALSVEAEYFKSQRQIIIDTEKLIAANLGKNSKAFKSQSNLIGDDQKILRLRYGVFLGEEFATTGGLGEVDHSGHDHGAETGHSDEGEAHEQQAASESNFSNEIYNSPEMAAYVHAHDDSEIATFFDSKTKQLLKEALANMWEAELYLRTYKPKQALPYEHKALKLIKEVQQASRIYVERIGFEPPPLEPLKKRLSGELSAIIPKESNTEQAVYEDFEEQLIAYSKSLNQYVDFNSKEVLITMTKLGQLLANEIDKNPLIHAKLLSYIAQFKEQPSLALYEEIQYVLAQLLPALKTTTTAVNSAGLKINEVFNQTEIN